MKRNYLLSLAFLSFSTLFAVNDATVIVSKKAYLPTEKISLSFKSKSSHYYGYIAIYGENQDIKGTSTKAYSWAWTHPKTTGTIELDNPGVGRFFAIYRDGRTNLTSSELSERVYFYVTPDGVLPVPKAELIFSQTTFENTTPISFTTRITKTTNDVWVGIYPQHADIFSMFSSPKAWKNINGTQGSSESISFENPGIGRWFAVVRSGKTSKYSDAISEYFYFDVVNKIKKPTLSTAKQQYENGENISIAYKDMPRDNGDKIILYHNLSKAPLKKMKLITDEQGTFSLGTDLQAGKYRAIYEKSNGKRVGNTLQFSVSKPQNNTEYGSTKIAVISDVHIMAPELVIKDGSAFQNYLKEDRKLLEESAEIAKALSNELQKENPQILLVPGDLTKDGERVSHQLFVKTFQPLIDAGSKIIVVPGNHDINNPHAVTFNGEKKEYTETVTPDEFKQIYHNFGFGDAISQDKNSLSYVVEPVEGLRIFALDVCKYEDNTYKKLGATSDSCVTEGELKPSTILWLKEQTNLARKAGKQMIAMMHHNVIEHFNGQADFAAPYLLDNYTEAQKVLIEAQIPIVFTGHFHSTDIAKTEHSGRYLYEIETGAPVTYPCPYRIMELNEQLTEIKIDTRYIEDVKWDTGELSFQEYAQKSLGDGIPNVMKWLVDYAYDDIKKMIPEKYKSFISIPERKTLGDMVANHFANPATNLLLTHNEGNEQLKDGQFIIDAINAGIEALAYDLATIPGTGGRVASEVKQLEHYQLLQTGLKSILGNQLLSVAINNNSSNPISLQKASAINDATIDDLYAHITLPRPVSIITGYERTNTNTSFSVYPNISHDGKVLISIPNNTVAHIIEIFNIQGQVIDTIVIDSNTPANITYIFENQGTYLIRFDGNTEKVIVK